MAELTIVDISALFTGDPGAQRTLDARIGRAVRECGGFVISGYPDADQVDLRALTMLSFFDLPDDAKRAVATRLMNPESSRIYRGYIASLEPDSWAHNEFFDIGPDDPVPGPPIPGMEILAETNVWPAQEPARGWQEAMRAYYRHMTKIAMAVMLSVGRSAGCAEEDLEAHFKGGNSTLRLLNYPLPPGGIRVIDELPEETASEADAPPLVTGRHTDGSGLSLLWQREPGLQAQAPDGTWRDVPRVENCISVHLGDVLEIMTDGRLPATPHRVINHGTARQSIGFFLEPALSARLSQEPPQATSAETAARGTYGWHLLRRMNGYQGYEHLVPRPE